MGDHSQAFHLVEVFLDLWVQGNGAFPGGMYHQMNIMTESDCVLTRKSTNSCEPIWKLFHQVISGSDGLGCCCCGSRAGLRGLVSGWATVMAQFIFTTTNLSHDGRPRMVGPGVSATYQYECTLWGQAPGQPGCQVMGPWSAPNRDI